jgi:hypothetical protein
MALLKDKLLSNGVLVKYWKIININYNKPTHQVYVTVGSFVSPQSCISGNVPVVTKTYKFAHNSDLLSIDDFYTPLKAHADFANAEDC